MSLYSDNKWVDMVRSCYRWHYELPLSQNIGWNGATASERQPITFPEVSDDILIYAGGVNFSNANALVRIKATNPNYEWMGNNDATPIETPVHQIFGIATAVMPLIPLIQPFWLGANGTIQATFINSAASLTTGGTATLRALRLRDKLKPLPWELPNAA